jgi:hypothetical protein
VYHRDAFPLLPGHNVLKILKIMINWENCFWYIGGHNSKHINLPINFDTNFGVKKHASKVTTGSEMEEVTDSGTNAGNSS